MTIDLEKLLKESKINIFNSSFNFISSEPKNDINPLEEAFLKDLIKNDAEKGPADLVKFIQKNIGYALSAKVIKEILSLESEFFINLNNNNNGKSF